MKNKVTFVAFPSGHGGIETVLEYLLHNKEMNNLFDLNLWCFNKIEYVEWLNDLKGIKVNDSKHKSMIYCYLRYVLFLIFYSDDCLVILNPVQIYLAHIIKKVFLKKYTIVSWIHSSFAEPGVGQKKKMIKKADYYLAISSGIKNEYINAGFDENKIFLIFNPIHKEKETIESSNNEKIFIYVGRLILDGQKNIRGILNTLKKVSGNWKFKIYGDGKDRDEAEKIVNENLNLSKKVEFLGWSNNPWKEIKNANALLLNSNYEGFGMVLAEAISRGLPCISSNCSAGPDDLIINGVNGFLYRVNDYKGLEEILNKFINNDVNFNHEKVKKTLNKYYDPKYINRFSDSLKFIIKNK